MKTFSIKEAIKRGWHLFKSRWKLLAFSTLIFLALNGFSGMRNHDYREVRMGGFFLVLLMIVVATILKIGWLKMLLKIEEGHHTELKELVAHSDLFFRFLIASILCGLVIALGFILLIIPGIYFAIKYSFVPILALETDLKYKELFKKSAHMTDGVKWKLLGFSLVIILLNILGAVLIGIGLLASVPVTVLAYLHVYRKLLNHTHPVAA